MIVSARDGAADGLLASAFDGVGCDVSEGCRERYVSLLGGVAGSTESSRNGLPSVLGIVGALSRGRCGTSQPQAGRAEQVGGAAQDG